MADNEKKGSEFSWETVKAVAPWVLVGAFIVWGAVSASMQAPQVSQSSDAINVKPPLRELQVGQCGPNNERIAPRSASPVRARLAKWEQLAKEVPGAVVNAVTIFDTQLSSLQTNTSRPIAIDSAELPARGNRASLKPESLVLVPNPTDAARAGQGWEREFSQAGRLTIDNTIKWQANISSPNARIIFREQGEPTQAGLRINLPKVGDVCTDVTVSEVGISPNAIATAKAKHLGEQKALEAWQKAHPTPARKATFESGRAATRTATPNPTETALATITPIHLVTPRFTPTPSAPGWTTQVSTGASGLLHGALSEGSKVWKGIDTKVKFAGMGLSLVAAVILGGVVQKKVFK